MKPFSHRTNDVPTSTSTRTSTRTVPGSSGTRIRYSYSYSYSNYKELQVSCKSQKAYVLVLGSSILVLEQCSTVLVPIRYGAVLEEIIKKISVCSRSFVGSSVYPETEIAMRARERARGRLLAAVCVCVCVCGTAGARVRRR